LINLNNTTDPSNANKSQIEQNLREVATKQKEASKYTYITRRDFLNMASKYLLIDTKQVNITVNYKDLTEAENKIVNYIFNQSVTWKDDFGQTYFQPDKKITRGE
jgi:septum formation topological specificity factor MinE